MSKKGLAFFAAFILFGSLIMVNGLGMGAPLMNAPIPTLMPVTTFPAVTKIPYFSYAPTDAAVNITDTNLKKALHTIAGIPDATPIYRSDLAKLTGGLDLSNKGIAKAEGLQYCENITDLNLSGNKLQDLPSSFNKLVNLQSLALDGNKFTKLPDAIFTLPKLASLSMKNNQIAKVADKFNMLPLLTFLDLSGNKPESIPASLPKLAKLQYLFLAKDGLKDSELPNELFLMPELTALDLSGNQLGGLPNQITTMPKLKALNVEGNLLDTLPPGLGNAPALQQVYAAKNRLTIVEPSLLNGKITNLTLDVNRISDLPQGLAGMTFDTFSIEWNFIDMSEGSDARKIGDSVNAPSGKAYLRQLKYLEVNPQYQATSTTVTLSWQLLQDGTDGDGSWKVSKYLIYLDKDGTWVNLQNKQTTIAELDKLAGQYVVTDLSPGKSYKFQIGVEYALELNGVKATHRYFVPLEAKTIEEGASAAPTAEVTATPADTAAGEITAAPTEAEPTATAASAKPAGSNDTIVVVLIIVIGVLLIGLIIETTMLMQRRGQRY